MNILVIGAAGFVGKHLIRHLSKNQDNTVIATKLQSESLDEFGVARVLDLDISHQDDIEALLREVQPDHIYHLAAQSSVQISWEKPDLTFAVNVNGVIHLLEAHRRCASHARVLLVGSSEEYGFVTKESAITEKSETRPGNPYAVSKLCQNHFCTVYAKAYGMDIIMVRAFNHIGPGQLSHFVAPSFCKQVAEVEKGMREPVIRVGNLKAKRDFSDVRDIVRAYDLLMLHGKAGETYNVGSGEAIPIERLLEEILSLSDMQITVEIDPEKYRPLDVPIVVANITKLRRTTGFRNEIPLRDTLQDVLEEWRGKTSRELESQ